VATLRTGSSRPTSRQGGAIGLRPRKNRLAKQHPKSYTRGAALQPRSGYTLMLRRRRIASSVRPRARCVRSRLSVTVERGWRLRLVLVTYRPLLAER
jgi:hypothetical protein